MPRKDGRPKTVPLVKMLDPQPLVHRHAGCHMDGQRALLHDRVPQDEFEPRDGYSTNEEDYYA